jgi:hypothetical protein
VSKSVVKTDRNQVPQKVLNDLQKHSQLSSPQLREVNIPAAIKDNQSIITAYKDLDQSQKDFALNQKKHLIIGLVVFFVLGLGIIIGQKRNEAGDRFVASEAMNKIIPKDAVLNSSERYQYEKSCYIESNGENVCTTRVVNNRK